MNDRRQPSWRLLLLGLGAVVLGFFPLCTYQVRLTEAAIVETFGRFALTTAPGLHAKWPYPFQKVHKLDTTRQLLQTQYDENYLADGKNVVLTLFAVWRIADPARLLGMTARERDGRGSKDRAREFLGELIRTEKAAVLSRHPLDHLVATAAATRQYPQIEQEILERVQPQAAAKYGLAVEALGIEKLMLTPAHAKEVLERMATERQNQAAATRQQGELRAGQIRAEAQQASARLVSDAQVEAAAIRSQADQEAAKLYETFQEPEARELAIFLRQLTALEEILSRKTMLIVDRDSPPFSLLKGEFLAPPGAAPAQP